MKVYNRSDGNITYKLPELNVRRVFNIGESKDIPKEELEALFQTDGGAQLLKDYLLVEDKEWVMAHWEAPIEYFWKEEEIKKCLMEDPVDLFEETMDYAPRGVLDLIKTMAWRIPVTDLNKVGIIRDKTGFDVLLAIEAMKQPEKPQTAPTPARRRRQEA